MHTVTCATNSGAPFTLSATSDPQWFTVDGTDVYVVRDGDAWIADAMFAPAPARPCTFDRLWWSIAAIRDDLRATTFRC